MRRGRIPELGLFLLAYQLLQNIGLTNIPPVTLATIAAQVPAPPRLAPPPPYACMKMNLYLLSNIRLLSTSAC